MVQKRRGWRFWLVQGLTVCRGPFMVLVFGLTAYAMSTAGKLTWAQFIFAEILIVAAAVSDAFDGHCARRYGLVSRFGKNIDPFMDKMFYVLGMVMLCLLAMQRGEILHAWWLGLVTVVFLARDLWITTLRAFVAMHPQLKLDAGAGKSGKWRTIISFPMVCVVYLYLAVPISWVSQPPAIARTAQAFIGCLEIAAVLATIYSLYDYTRRYRRCLQAELSL